MVTQVEIARQVGLDVSSVNKILNRRSGAVFRPETIQKVFRVARKLGFDFERLKHQHRREAARKPAALAIELSVYLADGKLFDRGQATLRDVSLSGALLSAIVLTKRAIPVVPHTLGIRMLEGPNADLEILGRPVRIEQDKHVFNLAIEFLSKERAKAGRLVSRA